MFIIIGSSWGKLCDWLGIWILISIHLVETVYDLFYIKEIIIFWNSAFISQIITGKRFEKNGECIHIRKIRYHQKHHRLFYVSDLINSFNNNMHVFKVMDGLYVLIKSVVIFYKKTTWMVFCKEKNRPRVNEYDANVC